MGMYSRSTRRRTGKVKPFSADKLLPQAEFLKRFKISKQDFANADITWKELCEIFDDYIKLKVRLVLPAQALANIFHTKEARDTGIHSVRFRIKDSNGLIEKIIRKKIARPSRKITLANYREQITDLIGIRALHVFKNDILLIHQFITTTFDLKAKVKPIHYYRKGDEADFLTLCKGLGCKQEEHTRGYRSFHYIISTRLTKQVHFAEIQIRTIFEEGWSEIDHRVRYNFKMASTSPFDEQLSTLNKLASAADESGGTIKRLEQEEQEKILKPKKRTSTRRRY